MYSRCMFIFLNSCFSLLSEKYHDFLSLANFSLLNNLSCIRNNYYFLRKETKPKQCVEYLLLALRFTCNGSLNFHNLLSV